MPNATMEKKIASVYEFLVENQQWNANFQLLEYRRSQGFYTDPWGKIRAQLHAAAYSQSQPKLDLLMTFWQRFEATPRPKQSKNPSLDDLIKSISPGERIHGDGPWDSLFRTLKNQDGWGPKTAALFVNKVIKIHRSSENRDLHFLSEPKSTFLNIDKGSDRLYLPVDSVIMHIFGTHFSTVAGQTFSGINKYLSKHYSPDQILIWDDLWFWGFITQHSSKNDGKADRKTRWNEAKAWSLQFLPKEKINDIRSLAIEFARLLDS